MERFKFRCWDTYCKRMRDEQDYVIDPDIGQPRWIHDNEFMQEIAGQLILMQCTGQKDSDGKLIFEGDIVEVGRPDNNYTVIFKGMGFWYKDEEEGDLWVFTAPSYELKVTGNIYEQT